MLHFLLQRHKAFFKIKQKMTDELNRRLPDRKTSSQRGKSKSGGKDQPRGNSQQHKVAVKKLAGRVKTGALNVLKHSRGKTQLAFWGGAKDNNAC
jgi:hypothetical protein